MVNLLLEVAFWLILVSYVGARVAQPKKGFRKQY